MHLRKLREPSLFCVHSADSPATVVIAQCLKIDEARVLFPLRNFTAKKKKKQGQGRKKKKNPQPKTVGV